MSNILIVPPKSVDAATKKVLKDNGVILVEMKEPEKARIITPEINYLAGDVVMSALKAVSSDILGKAQSLFVKDLLARLYIKEETK